MPWVDEDKCTGCGVCEITCPRGVRRDLPESAEERIRKVLEKMGEMLQKCENLRKGQFYRELRVSAP